MYDNQQKADLNITPLVDVMLVLLALLMVTTPVVEYEEKIVLPKGSVTKELGTEESVKIYLLENRTITMNSKSFPFDSFESNFLLQSSGISKDVLVHIRADEKLLYKDIMFVLKTVKENGFSRVSLVTDG